MKLTNSDVVRNKVLLAIFVLLVAVIAFLLWRNQPQPSESRSEKNQTKQSMPDEYPQPSLTTQSREEAVKAYVENSSRDLRYDWKIPIRFYGRVIDQYDQPVAAARIDIQWTDLSSKGTSEVIKQSDAKGLFSLEGVKGKRLILRINKEGFYDVSGENNQLSFEFANPAEQVFYEPDPNNPAIFVIRKKGETEPLIVKSLELRLSGQGTIGTVDLLTGKESPSDGQLQVTVWKPTITTEQINAGKVFPYDWRVQVKINDGGLKEHKDIFPFEAPESGYIAEYDERLHAINGGSSGVSVDKQFYFYFGEPRTYGRMHFKTDGHRSLIFIDYWLNPSGSRNLEYDPDKPTESP